MNHARNAEWNSILKIAYDTDTALARCSKPGQRLRYIYSSSHRRACERGYRGTERDWETFVRVRANAENKKRPADTQTCRASRFTCLICRAKRDRKTIGRCRTLLKMK
jgi:hypothetical protein